MICPFPDCGRNIESKDDLTQCNKCGQPVQVCTNCKEVNRTFARYCRACKSSLGKTSPKIASVGQAWEAKLPNGFPNESRRIEIRRGIFWTVPIAYKGYFWCLSTTGEISRISPFNSQEMSFGGLGGDFGKSPPVIREIMTQDDQEPFLLALGSQSVKGISLLNKEIKVFYKTQSDEHILYSIENNYTTIQADNSTVYFFKEGPSGLKFVSCSLLSGAAKSFPTNSSTLAGPFMVKNQVGFYNTEKLFILTSGELRSYAFPNGFNSWTSSKEVKDLQPHHGRMPFLIRGNTIYIPGARKSDGVSGFMMVTFKSSTPSFDPIWITGDATYTQDFEDRPVISLTGEIILYDGISSSITRADEQLTADGPAYYDRYLTIGFVKGSGRVESLRFFPSSQKVVYPTAKGLDFYDYALAKIPDFEVSFGFTNTVGALVFSYLTKENNVRMLVWDI
jgi:hypothetical protein